jgi:flagellar biosynthesis/type III secretory pathway protein FliH
MSSSRIIKAALNAQQPFAGFSLETLHEEENYQSPGSADEFQTLFTMTPDPSGDRMQQQSPGHVSEKEHTGDTHQPDVEELQQLLQESCDRGFAEGRKEAEESFSEVCRTLTEAIGAVGSLRERIIRGCEADLLRLAMMVAKQIVRREISQDRKILAQFISEATAGIAEHTDISICFNPEDYRAVTANRQLYLEGIGDKMQITIKPDESVSVGGCVVETQTGLVDARVETQLAEIFKRLMLERGHCGDESLELPAEAELYLAEQCGAEKNGYQRD